MKQDNIQKQKMLEKVHDTNQRRVSCLDFFHMLANSTCFPVKLPLFIFILFEKKNFHFSVNLMIIETMEYQQRYHYLW